MFRLQKPVRLLILALPLLLIFLTACGVTKLYPTFSHQGRLLDASGNPVPDGTYEVEYRLFHAATGGTAVHTETQNVTVEDGLFTTSIGAPGTVDPTVYARATWLEVVVDGEVLTPRQRLLGSPYAFSLASGAVAQGAQPLEREYAGQVDTGAAFTVWNTDGTATGGNGLLAINSAAATGADRNNVAALQARAIGGVATDGTGAYGAIVTSNAYRGLYAEGATAYYSAYFNGDIYVAGNCVGCAMVYFAQNVGAQAINAGDFVAIEGVTTDADLGVPVMQVRKATSPDDAIIGVAAGAATRSPVGETNGVVTGGFEAADGPAAAGSYLSVTVQGLVQARAAGTGIQPGASLSAGTDGAEVAANGFTRALSSVDADGMVWVMLNGQ